MSFFERLMGRKSAKSAKERLQMVLIHDRTDLTPAILEALKEELLAVIARHVDIDPSTIRVELENEGRSQRLIADIPLRPAARRKS
ncbi:MAG: cell division topological specificity factor MinE [Anaerolineae bacterium CG_4_9_14_3_um_filter_57_17]|nr:cell division topological specificity factor MinE [bacterium]NCT22069.1 cell division topological specificity factor MinE [bacterium]OIO84893.1 MAG: cell division topological specificity factor MinE [Anaerolineae bacterium CG2_30_57_67]PJB64812.1 MAG: cell division topological specificity factor MinE [Anaerolineae bacterium CG_4_9_14_3_um_filter_57_17]